MVAVFVLAGFPASATVEKVGEAPNAPEGYTIYGGQTYVSTLMFFGIQIGTHKSDLNWNWFFMEAVIIDAVFAFIIAVPLALAASKIKF